MMMVIFGDGARRRWRDAGSRAAAGRALLRRDQAAVALCARPRRPEGECEQHTQAKPILYKQMTGAPAWTEKVSE